MAIENGQVANPDEVLQLAGLASGGYISDVRVAGYNFNGEAQNRYAVLYDSDVTEFNTLEADDWLSGYEVLSADSDVDTTNTTMSYDERIGYICSTLYDDFENDIVDLTKWTIQNAVTESGGQLLINFNSGTGTAFARTDGTGAGFDGKLANSSFVFDAAHSGTGNNPRVRITNGTTSVTVVTLADQVRRSYEFYFDVVAETVKYRIKSTKSAVWGAWSAGIDISSVTTNWYVEFYGAQASGGHVISVSNTCYVQGAVTNVIESNGYDHYSSGANYVGTEITLDHGIITANKELNGGTASWLISSNSGTNFSTLNENEISPISTASSQLVLAGSITTSSTRPAYIYEFGVKGWD